MRLIMEFEKGGVITAELLAEKAPVTTALICAGLPYVAELIHAQWAGEEVFFNNFPIASSPPLENPSKFFDTGGVIALVPSSKSFCIFYGRSIPRRAVDVDIEVSVFATINERQNMKMIGQRIRRQGVEKVIIKLE